VADIAGHVIAGRLAHAIEDLIEGGWQDGPALESDVKLLRDDLLTRQCSTTR
jgi:hypothetical protein